VDVEVPGGERRVSTINLLGCSTSVALATGPTDEEEEEGYRYIPRIYDTYCFSMTGLVT